MEQIPYQVLEVAREYQQASGFSLGQALSLGWAHFFMDAEDRFAAKYDGMLKSDCFYRCVCRTCKVSYDFEHAVLMRAFIFQHQDHNTETIKKNQKKFEPSFFD